MKTVAVAVLCTALAGVFSSAQAQSGGSVAAGFDCARAERAVDRLICAQAVLRWQDQALVRAYRAARAAASEDQRKVLLDEQRVWLSERDAHCVGRTPFKALTGERGRNAVACLRQRYLERRLALQDSVGAPLPLSDIRQQAADDPAPPASNAQDNDAVRIWHEDRGHGTFALLLQARRPGSAAVLLAWGGRELQHYFLDAAGRWLFHASDLGIMRVNVATLEQQRLSDTGAGDAPLGMSADGGRLVWSTPRRCGEETQVEADEGAARRVCSAALIPISEPKWYQSRGAGQD